MHNNIRDQLLENKGHAYEELKRQLADRLLKIKTYKEQETDSDPIDVRGLFKNHKYRRQFLHEEMESNDSKLRLLAVDAYMIDKEIQKAKRKERARKEEKVIDASSASVLSVHRVPAAGFAKHEEKNNSADLPVMNDHMDSDASRRKPRPKILMLNEAMNPQAVHEEDSSLPSLSSSSHPIHQSAKRKKHKNDMSTAKREHEHPKLSAGNKDPHAGKGHDTHGIGGEGDEAETDEGHKQPLLTYGIISVLLLLLVLVVTETEEEEGEEGLAENVEEEGLAEHMQAELPAQLEPGSEAVLAPESMPGVAGARDRLPPLLPESALDPRAEDILRIHGSHMLEAELMPMLVMSYLASIGATDIKLVGINPHDKIVQAKLSDREVPITIEIESHESSTAFDDMHEGKASIGVALEQINKDEIAKLLDHSHNKLKPAGEHIIGLDGLAIIVNRSNPVSSLSMQQVAKLFSGSVSDWSQVGGSPGPVNLHVRGENAGTTESFNKLVLERDHRRLAESHTIFASDMHLSDSVAADPEGIGFVRFPYIGHAKALQIADAASEIPIRPVRFRAETEEYPLSRRLYMYTSSPRKHQPLVDKFVFFVDSLEGQAIVEKMDFIPQTIYKEKPIPLQNATSAYRAMTHDAERLSLNFHFLPGQIDMDTKGIHDIARVAKFIKTNPAKEVLLIGFTDNQGEKARNKVLAAKRAEQVAQRLREYGLQSITAKGLGEIMPIASNDTEFGRNRNRRVEVWVK